MVKAAVRGKKLDFMRPPSRAFGEDGADLIYVKDCGRAIALLHLADKLRHSTYNIGTGEALKNGTFAAAIKKILPDAQLDLPAGFDPGGPRRVFELDTPRLREDTGFEPQYDLARAIEDYISTHSPRGTWRYTLPEQGIVQEDVVKEPTPKKRDGKRIFLVVALVIVVVAILIRRFSQLVH